MSVANVISEISGSPIVSNPNAADFKTGGIKADRIAESTLATGVTVDGVLIKDSEVNANTIIVASIDERNSNSGVLVEGVILKDTTIDLKGTADAIILDSDNDTTISAPTDDQIDFEVGGSDLCVMYANGVQDHGNEAVTATTIGDGTALITQGARFVTITCDTATKQVSLPAATVGDEITLYVGANGCEIISAVSGDKINNVVVGATNELAMAATSFMHLRYWAADNWSANGWDTAGAILATMTPDTAS